MYFTATKLQKIALAAITTILSACRQLSALQERDAIYKLMTTVLFANKAGAVAYRGLTISSQFTLSPPHAGLFGLGTKAVIAVRIITLHMQTDKHV